MPTKTKAQLERELSIVNDALEAALATSPVRDDNFFTPGGLSDLYEGRNQWDRKKIFAESLRAWRVNPLARRIVQLISSFIIGKGIAIKCDDGPTEKFLLEWWNHPLNKIGKNAKRWKDEDTRSGNLFFLFSTDATGMSFVRAVPAEQIDEIETKENDIEQETRYTKDTVGEDAYIAYNPQDDQDTFMLHFASNKVVGSVWGEADLSCMLVWIGRFSSWLEDRVRLNRFRTAFMYIIKGAYKSEAERKARETQLNANPPKPGSVLVLNSQNGEEWEIQSAKLDSFDANADGLAIKKMISAGVGFPLHYLAEPESATRTTAEAAGTPTFRTLEEAQADFFDMLASMARVACEVRARVDNSINPKAKIEIVGPDITERDNATLALALGRAYPQLADMFDRDLIDEAEVLRVSYKMFAETWEGKKPKGKKKPITQPKPAAGSNEPGIEDDKSDETDPKEEPSLQSITINVPPQEPPVVTVNVEPTPLTVTNEVHPSLVRVSPRIVNEVKVQPSKETLTIKRGQFGEIEKVEKEITNGD